MPKNILITGGGGFLGKHLIKRLSKNKGEYNISCTCRSSLKVNQLQVLSKNLNTEIKIFNVDITCNMDIMKLKQHIIDNKIDYIVHCAAMKYMDIAEEEPSRTINTNIIGTLNLIRIAKETNIKNIIALSTDKAIDPINVYGSTKYLMEKIILEAGYSNYQGVNFFWSDGSVLDIWYNQMKKNKTLFVTNFEQSRYYITNDYICEDIINNLDTKGKTLVPKLVKKISLKQLYESFSEYFNYNDFKILGTRNNEKKIEKISDDSEVYNPNKEEIMKMIDETIKSM